MTAAVHTALGRIRITRIGRYWELSVSHSAEDTPPLKGASRVIQVLECQRKRVQNAEGPTGPQKTPRLKPSTGLALVSTRSNQGKHRIEAILFQVAPITVSEAIVEELPLTRHANAPLLSIKWIHKDPFKRSGHRRRTTHGPIASISCMSKNPAALARSL